MNEQQEKVVKGKPYLCISLVVGLIVSIWVLEKWFLPWLGDFSSRAYCEEVLGLNGSIVLFAGMFIGSAFLFFLFTCWLSWGEYKKAKSGQTPAPGALVCRDTVVQPYTIGKMRRYMLYLVPLLGVGMVILGAKLFLDFKAEVIDPGLKTHEQQCASRYNKASNLNGFAVVLLDR